MKANRATIQQAQLDRLRTMFVAIKENRFYRPRLHQAGLAEDLHSLDDFFARMPFTTKAQLVEDQRAHPPFGTNLNRPLKHYVRMHQTSGTTGHPLRWLDTGESWQWILSGWRTVYGRAGVTPDDILFAAFSFAPFIGFWSAFESASELGCLCIPGGGLNSLSRLRMILQTGVSVLCCTPTYALHLAEVARKEGLDLARSSVRLIIVAGEPGGSVPSMRSLLTEQWAGARVFDHHGMTEMGPVTYECPGRAGLLMMNEQHYLAEVLDSQSLQPVEPGQIGELVLTTLGRDAPLLRYRTGDLVQPILINDRGDPGHLLGLERGILGRADDMVIVRGVNVYPSAVDQVVRRHEAVVEYQVHVSEQRSMVELKVVAELRDGVDNPSEIAHRLQEDFRQTFSLRIPVHQVAGGSLPRYELKANRWIRGSE